MGDRVVCVVQARMGSSRLPGKSLRVLAGRPLVAHVLERAAAIPGLAGVVLATSDTRRDDPLATLVASLGYGVVRGPELDVLERVRVAARLARADVVVRVTGDCPLLCPEVGGRVVQAYADGAHLFGRPPVEYVWNDTARSGYPDGTDVEVFSREALEAAAARATDRAEREHVTRWIRQHYPVATVGSTADWSRLKLSVDSVQDYVRVLRIYQRLPVRALTLDATLAAARAVGVLQ